MPVSCCGPGEGGGEIELLTSKEKMDVSLMDCLAWTHFLDYGKCFGSRFPSAISAAISAAIKSSIDSVIDPEAPLMQDPLPFLPVRYTPCLGFGTAIQVLHRHNIILMYMHQYNSSLMRKHTDDEHPS